MTHCWKSKLEHLRQTYGPASKRAIEYELSLHEDGDVYKERKPAKMCMLPCGHHGPHVWTSVEDIDLTFD